MGSGCEQARRQACASNPPGPPCLNRMAQNSRADCGVPACASEAQRVCATWDNQTAAPRMPRSSLGFPPSGGGGGMSAPQADFMDTMNYVGTGTFSGKFYQGPVKKYTLQLASSEPVTWFFYYTTPDDHPVCQGEGGDAPDSQKGQGIFVWHEYNVTSFQATTHTDETFAIPSICQATTNTCEFPN